MPKDLDLPIHKSDFRETSSSLTASRDVGAQLFCSLLRSAGVDARLVCSLQPLPIVAVAKGTIPQKSVPVVIISDPGSRTATSGDESGSEAKNDAIVSVPRAVGSVAGRSRFVSPKHGQALPLSNSDSTNTPIFPKPSQQSLYPASVSHPLT